MEGEAVHIREYPRVRDPALGRVLAAQVERPGPMARLRAFCHRLGRRVSGVARSASRSRRTVLFYRDLMGFTGGHLKVWDYFNHVLSSPDHLPLILVSKRTRWDEQNPWLGHRRHALTPAQGVRPDILFLAGLDWVLLDAQQRPHPSVPVINLIQGTTHADPTDLRYGFLRRKAIRICLGDELATAIAETGQVNGPVFVIPAGIDLTGLPREVEPGEREWDILIVARKQPALGRHLLGRLTAPGRRVALLDAELPTRAEFLSRIARARITVFLPFADEGFFLPALEGMALGTLVVCPDCVGNRSFCRPGDNCFRPTYSVDELLEAAEAALRQPAAERDRMLASARRTAREHDLMEERRAFLGILEDAGRLWGRMP